VGFAVAIAAFVVIDLCVMCVVITAFVAPVRELGKQFPPTPPAAGAVRRNFQSFRFGVLNAGSAIHVAVDDRCLHLSPSWLMRLMRMPAMSIPWANVRLIHRGKRATRVRIESERERMEVKGPTWCLELASA